jgi:Domain of unknown function (DUF4157)
MLQAPIRDRQTKAEASSKTAQYLPEYEQSSQSMGGIGRFSKREASPTGQSHPLQQRENFAALQKAYGNQAVLRMIGRSSGKPTVNSSAFTQSRILQRKCACGNSVSSSGTCSKCQQKEAMLLQRSSNGAERASEVPPIVHEVINSSGQPLEAETRAFMEPRFQHDFSHVRVHTDTKAAMSAQAVNALAYTVGQHIVFGGGQFTSNTDQSRWLLAHELTHTIQQASDSGTKNSSQPQQVLIDHSLEENELIADRVANSIRLGMSISPQVVKSSLVAKSPPFHLQRQVANSDTPSDILAESNRMAGTSGEEMAGDVDLSCHYRLGCPITAACEGKRVCGVASCGTGECRSSTCPPGFKNVIFKAWCQYDCLPSGSAFLFITALGNFVVGPVCLD